MPTESIPNDSMAIMVPFQISPTGGVASVTGQDAILKQEMIGLLMTNHYERLMTPHWGADVQSKIFDPLDELSASDSGNMIKEALSSISALLNISSVRFYQDPQEPSGAILEVRYSISGQSSLLQVRFVDGILTSDDEVL